MTGTGENSGLFSGTIGDRIGKGELSPEDVIKDRYEQAAEDFRKTISRAKRKHDPFLEKCAHDIALESLKRQWERGRVEVDNGGESLTWYIAAYKYILKELEKELTP